MTGSPLPLVKHGTWCSEKAQVILTLCPLFIACCQDSSPQWLHCKPHIARIQQNWPVTGNTLKYTSFFFFFCGLAVTVWMNNIQPYLNTSAEEIEMIKWEVLSYRKLVEQK